MFHCKKCNQVFTKKHFHTRHEKEGCGGAIPSGSNDTIPLKKVKISIQGNQARTTQNNISVPVSEDVEEVSTAFRSRICTYRFFSKKNCIDHKEFFANIYQKVSDFLMGFLQKHVTVKVNFQLFANYVKQDNEIFDVKSFNTKNKIITGADKWEDKYKEFVDEIMLKSEKFQEKDSGMSTQIL